MNNKNRYFIYFFAVFQIACSGKIPTGLFVQTYSQGSDSYERRRITFDKQKKRYTSEENAGLLFLQDSGIIVRNFFNFYLLTDKKLVEKVTYGSYGSQDSFYIKIYGKSFERNIKCVIKNEKQNIAEKTVSPCAVLGENEIEILICDELSNDSLSNFIFKLHRMIKINNIFITKEDMRDFDRKAEKKYFSMKTHAGTIKIIQDSIHKYNCINVFVDNYTYSDGFNCERVKFKDKTVELFKYDYMLKIKKIILSKLEKN
jgi:hypothetical protein